jgi:hypothetical protein
MTRPAIALLSLLCVLALAPLASAAVPARGARVIELGATTDTVTPSCPADPCEAAVRVSGYQGRAGANRNPFVIPRDGYIVAFSLTLAKPTAAQISFFNTQFGTPAQVRLSVLRKSDGRPRRTRLDHRLMAQTRDFRVDRFFGSKPTFVLAEPLRVRRGYYLALTVDTWAPVFANGLGRSSWWRSSRDKSSCEAPRSLAQFALSRVGNVNVFGCTYHGARLLYTATYVPDNRPTVPASGDRRQTRR